MATALRKLSTASRPITSSTISTQRLPAGRGGVVGRGVVTRQYTYGLQRIGEEQQISNVWTPSFYGYDGGGNVRQLTNSTGAVTDTYEYDAFGNAFTNQRLDTEQLSLSRRTI